MFAEWIVTSILELNSPKNINQDFYKRIKLCPLKDPLVFHELHPFNYFLVNMGKEHEKKDTGVFLFHIIQPRSFKPLLYSCNEQSITPTSL